MNLEHLLDTELSVRSRIGHVALLLCALAMTVVVASLWVTEPALPRRTQAAFALLVGIGMSWVGFAIRVLTTRRVLLATHRLLASRLATAFTGVFTAGALALGVAGQAAGYAAAAMGAVLLALAIGLLVRARRNLARLMERRDTLARELGSRAR